MEFKKYQHIERLGTTEVEGIESGTCYIFPKIDGTNGSIWIDRENNGRPVCAIRCGSRNRELSNEADNAGFIKHIRTELVKYKHFFLNNPNLRLFGEWLVPHSLKTYRDEAWRKFYVFDVVRDLPELPEEQGWGEKFEYLTYEEYKPLMDKYGLNYIPCIAIIENPTHEFLIKQLPCNEFLIKDGEGQGEGIVIKNYDYKNKYGRTTWAKIVTSEFKEKHVKEMGTSKKEVGLVVERKIVTKYCTTALIDKTYAKIVNEQEGWSSKFIPRLLNTVYYDLIKEESWNFIKEFKNPTIDFKQLLRETTTKIKELKPEIF